MQDLITSFIIQSKECRLRDVGKFRIVNNSARVDVANKQIAPPVIEIVFSSREEKISDGLVKYVSEKKKIPVADALDELKRWCSDTKNRLKKGEEILLEPLGVLKKGPSGNEFVRNSKASINFFEPVVAERVIHENTEHEMLVGDKHTTSSVMNHYYQEEETIPQSNRWKIFAIILLLIGLVLLFLHFYANPFSVKTVGNQQKVIPATAPKTYNTP
jgi:nucleoid DNA-binding protein